MNDPRSDPLCGNPSGGTCSAPARPRVETHPAHHLLLGVLVGLGVDDDGAVGLAVAARPAVLVHGAVELLDLVDHVARPARHGVLLPGTTRVDDDGHLVHVAAELGVLDRDVAVRDLVEDVCHACLPF